MQSKVKEFFNKLETRKIKKETIQEKALVNDNSRVRKWGDYHSTKRRPIRCWSADAKVDTNLYHFIDNDSSFAFIVWEDLEVDFSNIDRRYCENCNDFVYRASNISVLNKLYAEEKKVAISGNLMESIKGKRSDLEYQLFQNKMKITLFLMLYFKSKSDYRHKHDCEGLTGYIDTKTMKEILENIIGDMYALEWLDFFKIHDIDMEFVILEILDYINDDTFSHAFMEKLKILENKNIE